MQRRGHSRSPWTWFGLAIATSACFGGAFVQGLACERDADCGPGLRCVKDDAGDGLCGGPGTAAVCGNGLLDADEVCDDGNLAEADDCTPDCRLPVCGDGYLAPGEACDDGDTADAGTCRHDCTLPSTCGNGVVEADEACDDGNLAAGDACTPDCSLPVCGDGHLAPGEACDDGNTLDTDECTSTCALPACADGFVNGGEACDDSNDVETDACTNACTLSPEAPTLALNLAQVKRFEFSGTARGAEFYRLFERPAPGQEFVQVGDDSVEPAIALTAPLHRRAHASYRLQACNAVRCADSQLLDVTGTLADAIGYFKASNPGEDDLFGASLALSADGTTLAVGAPQERSAATGIDGDQADDSAIFAGAVYVFVRTGATWSQQAYVKASNTSAIAEFGASVALSADGGTLAVGAPYENSSATGIDGDQADDSAVGAGAVYVFVRTDATWSQQAYVKASNTDKFDKFGRNVALSSDGDTLAACAPDEDSQATGIDGNQNDDSVPVSGAVYIFERTGGTWSQQAYIKLSESVPGAGYDMNLALAGDGDTLAVGTPYFPEAVHVFARTGGVWSQQALVQASNAEEPDGFGRSVALSGDGDALAVGAPGEASQATGIDGDQDDDSAPDAGAAYVFVRTDGSWSQRAYVKASDTRAGDRFGANVALAGEGRILAVGAPSESSRATGVDGDSSDTTAAVAGATYVFEWAAETWSQRAYVKAPAPGPGYSFGSWTALTSDGDVLAVGSPGENGGLAGVGARPTDDSLSHAGAVFLY